MLRRFPSLWLVGFSILASTISATELEKDSLPEVVQVGAGSYATRPPRSQAARPGISGKAGWGDLSQVFTHMKLYVTEGHLGTEAIPSTDWWTSLVTKQWSGQLWAYPAMVKAEPAGVGIYFPKTWKLADNAKKMNLSWASKILVRGKGFKPADASAVSWSDWLVSFRMQETSSVWMKATLGHGLPYTWIETSGVDLRLDIENASFFTTGPATLPLTGSALGIESNGDCYGIYAPEGTRFEMDGGSLAVRFSGVQKWISVAVLPSRNDFALLQKYAPVVPRKTRVDWSYSPEKAEVATTWKLETENLGGGAERDVIQGWIPHHYHTSAGVKPGFEFIKLNYATPRGEMRCAVGREFQLTFPFRGLLPELPAPKVVSGLPNPYRPEVMKELINGYTSVTGYGSETYWGGKKILLFAKYMQMAKLLGQDEQYAIFKQRLTEALVDWYTYEPGESEHFFAMYPNWGSLLGFRTRDNANPGIDVLQDHAFCYAYNVYAASLLAMDDPQFAKDYGPMATLLVKDYANWDREDKRFPFFRSMDPWCGHSWSGGTGSEEGNGQESSSEAVQAWGAMFLLGEILDNKDMRAAAAFGYASESRAVAEYWFDREKTNIPRDLWPHAYNSNLQTNGVGWWTWFSGDEFWMHSIQWLPMSPLLQYLGEDPEFARWDYETMWKNKRVGGWETNLGNEGGVGNVTLSYLQLFDPDQAAKIFDELWDTNRGTAHGREEAAPTYYRLHAGRSLGKMRRDAWTDIPTSAVFRDSTSGKNIAVVYNTSPQDRECHLYEDGKITATFPVPARQLVTWREGSPVESVSLAARSIASSNPAPPTGPVALTKIVVEPPTALLWDKATTQFKANGYDQFGKPFPIQPQWKVEGKGTIDSTGLYTANGGGNFEQSRFGIVAEANAVQGKGWAAVEEIRRVADLNFTPPIGGEVKLPVGGIVQFQGEAVDQFKARYELPLTWTATGSVSVTPEGKVTAISLGEGSVQVQAGDKTVQIPFIVLSPEEINLAAFKPVQASSIEKGGTEPEGALDNNPKTRWASASSDPQWISVDLESPYRLQRLVLNWQNAAAKTYKIEFSDDGSTWRTFLEVPDGKAGSREFNLGGVQARYIRIYGLTRTTGYGYSLFEIEAYGSPAK